VKISITVTDEAVLRELGTRIARHRIDRGLSQHALASGAGIAKRTLERLESGDQVQLTTLVRVLRVLGLLDMLDLVVPEIQIQPVRLLQEGTRQRRRAPRKASGGGSTGTPSSWKWGDEK